MDTISVFLRDLRSCPRYTKEEERALAGRFATADEALEAREQLILSCAPYALALSKRYWGRCLEEEDLIQYAMVGLTEAVDAFDPSRGRLTTCVDVHVPKRVLFGIATDSHVVRLPNAVFWGQASAYQAEADRVRRGIQSLNSCHIDPEDERSLQADNGVVAAEEAIWLDECRESLEYAMHSLTDRERRIIRLRKAGMTLVGIGRQLGLSRERVRQVGTRALSKIRQALDCAGAMA